MVALLPARQQHLFTVPAINEATAYLPQHTGTQRAEAVVAKVEVCQLGGNESLVNSSSSSGIDGSGGRGGVTADSLVGVDDAGEGIDPRAQFE